MTQSRRYRYADILGRSCALSAALLLTCAQALAGEHDASEPRQYQIHGFASMGYLKSSGNNFYGDSTDGSFDYYEMGINGNIQFSPKFSAAGQLMARDAGETDDGKIRVDYAYLDYQFITLDTSRAGARLGRVRNPLGFYNESRDVLFTRPSILLPQSIYLEGTGVREILFSGDGLQMYSDWDHDLHHTAFKLNFIKSTDVSKTTRENFTGGGGFNVQDMQLNSPLYLQILHERDGGQLRFAASMIRAELDATLSFMGMGFPATIDSEIVALSAQINREKWSLTSEYSITSTEFGFGGGSSESRSDGMYLQGEYRYSPEWSWLMRYDVAYSNRNNRGTSDSRDTTVGATWNFRPNWILMGEFHNIDGTAGIPRIDNPNPPLEPRTKLFALMLGYRF